LQNNSVKTLMDAATVLATLTVKFLISYLAKQ